METQRISARTDNKGVLFIVSAPSGAGKTTLCQALRHRYPDLLYSISHTTRAPRPGEQNGIDYFFTSLSVFKQGIRNGFWAEWAEVHGNFYGTSAAFLEQSLTIGKGVLLDIDVQGTRQILDRFPETVTIFIMPPSINVLKARLVKRGTDDKAIIAQRLKNAEKEIAHQQLYAHVIINDDLAQAKADLIALFSTYRSESGWCKPGN